MYDELFQFYSIFCQIQSEQVWSSTEWSDRCRNQRPVAGTKIEVGIQRGAFAASRANRLLVEIYLDGNDKKSL